MERAMKVAVSITVSILLIMITVISVMGAIESNEKCGNALVANEDSIIGRAMYVSGMNEEYCKIALETVKNYTDSNDFIGRTVEGNLKAINEIGSNYRNIANILRDKDDTWIDNLGVKERGRIILEEAILVYYGDSVEDIDSFLSAYKEIKNKDGKLSDKGIINKMKKFGVLNADKLENELSSNIYIRSSEKVEDDGIILEYENGVNTADNLIRVAVSQIGKVRYIWGGGHLGTGNINEVNPLWKEVSDYYILNGRQGNCVRPGECWCGRHGYTVIEAEVCGKDDIINSVNEYFDRYYIYQDVSTRDIRKEYVFTEMKLGDDVNAHMLEGLDCSGFAVWLFNMIDNTRVYEGNAINFCQVNGFNEIATGSALRTGDIICWDTHMIINIGSVGNNTYVVIESAPNTIKLAVAYYTGASSNEINKAKEIASYYNTYYGGSDMQYEELNCYNINSKEIRVTETTDGGIEEKAVLTLGRSRTLENNLEYKQAEIILEKLELEKLRRQNV